MPSLQLIIKNDDGSSTIISASGITSTVVNPAPPPVDPPPVDPLAGMPVIPATATYFDMLPSNIAWLGNHDGGTSGSAKNIFTTYPMAFDGRLCRQFKFQTTGKGSGVIFHAKVTNNASQFNCFSYHKRERIVPPATWKNLGQLETDLEITDPKTGIPADMALQEDANSGAVDITANHKWTPTGVKIDPTKRDDSLWYETIEFFKHNADGTTTYRGVMIAGVYYPLNITVTSLQSQPWEKDILNMQDQYDTNQAAPTNYEILADILGVNAWKE